MKEILQKYLTVLRKDRNRHIRLMGVLTVLSVMIMAVVAWQLRFVGIAQADKPSCGLEEHVHTEACIRKELICTLKEGEPEPTVSGSDVIHHHGPECYEEVRTLECTEKEHTHSDKCYEINKILDCTKQEHVHTASCFEVQDVLICTEDHEHTASCYEQRKVPVCGKEAHTHNDDCYHIERKLICGEKEHVHDDNCYHVEQKLICGMEEGQVLETAPAAGAEPKLHVHTDDCYKITYICGKEEHKHTLACYSNLESDVETYQDWEKTFPKEWGKTWNENVLLMAQSQMGYKESEENFEIAEDGQTKKGYTRYGGWYGNPYGDWNTMFVSFCLNNAGIPFEAIPKSAGAYAFSTELKKMDLYEDSSYTPKAGDIVFLQDADSKTPSRTAVVAALGDMMMDDQKVPCITVIEGDLKSAVSPYKYPLEDPLIVGYLSVAAAYDRAVNMGLFLEDEMEVTPETEETTEPTEGRELTDEELDAKLAVVLDTFSKKAKEFEKVDRRGSEKSAKAIRLEMDELFLKIQESHGLRYPNAGEADFVKYMKTNAEDAYNTYTLACQKYPAKETQKPANKPERLNGDAVKLLKTMTEKAVAFETAVTAENTSEIRTLGEEMNLLYDQAMNLYLQQYPEKTAKDFGWYLEKNYPKADEMMKKAEELLHIRALNDMLNGKLTVFAEKAKQCALAMNIGDKSAETLKLDLDQLYLEMKDLHGKRYPNAKAEDFDIYLKNNDAKAVERYLSAVKTFPNVNLNSNITLSEPEKGEVRRVFRMDDGMEVEVSVTGTICFPIMEKAEEKLNAEAATANLETIAKEGVNPDNATQKSAENGLAKKTPNPNAEKGNAETDSNTDTEAAVQSRWDHIQLDLVPVSEDDELAFAEYLTENIPDAMGMTMLAVKCRYNGLDLNVSGADVSMTLKPSAQSLAPQPMISTMMLGDEEASAGPVIQNAPVLESLSPAEHAAEHRAFKNQKMDSDAKPVKMFILERGVDGKIQTVKDEVVSAQEKDAASLNFQTTDGAVYAAATVLTDLGVNFRPVEEETDVYPDAWAKEVVKKDLKLRDDPYFLKMAERDKDLPGVYKFETPKATLGYVLRNYNIFVYNDCWVKHVVGSAAVKGNAYYQENQGGTGASYIPIANYAPTYINGEIRKITNYSDPDKKPTMVTKEKLQIMVNNPDVHFPTYLGTVNDTIYTEGTKQHLFDGSNQFIDSGAKAKPIPYYYADNYILWDDFANSCVPLIEEGKIKGTYISKDDTSAAMPLNLFQWVPATGSQPTKLFLRMGHTYNLAPDALMGVELVLVPPEDYVYQHNEGNQAERGQDRANELALAKLDTVVTCYGDTVILPGHSEKYGYPQNVSKPAISYYVEDMDKPLNILNGDTFDVSLATVDQENATSSMLMIFPNATRVEIGKHAGHLIAPNATVSIPSTGDTYGCTICKDLWSAGDIHVLPYEGESDGIELPPEVEVPRIAKAVRDGSMLRPASQDEVFQFRLSGDKYISAKGNEKLNLPKVHYDGQNTWNAEMRQSPITIQALEDIRLDPKSFGSVFKDAIPESLGNPLDPDPQGKLPGTYIFKLSEIADPQNPDHPLGQKEFLRDTHVYTVEIDAAIDYLPDGTTAPNGNAQKKNFLVASKVTFKDANGKNVKNIVFENKVEKKTPELPHTGGIGTAPFAIFGVVTIIGASAYVIGRKRRIYQ